MHIYAYGSVCRGEVEPGSDIDVLAIADTQPERFDASIYSVYPYGRIRQLWDEGHPFSWHLHLEARLLYARNGQDFLCNLGQPAPYATWPADRDKFHQLYRGATDVLAVRRDTTVFELATIFLAIRNLAICYSLRVGQNPVFSRRAFERLGPRSLRLNERAIKTLEDARILSTRAYGDMPYEEDVANVLDSLGTIEPWIASLTAE
jgi:hypothetical protein